MPNFVGTLVTDEDGQICLKMRISPQNPEEYEIPMEELLEDYMGKRVQIQLLSVKPFAEVNFE
jgi:hypothetical protein